MLFKNIFYFSSHFYDALKSQFFKNTNSNCFVQFLIITMKFFGLIEYCEMNSCLFYHIFYKGFGSRFKQLRKNLRTNRSQFRPYVWVYFH